jgi:hypothetical protein
MSSQRQGLKRLTEGLGFSFSTVLLVVFVQLGTASAQCGPSGPGSANNTACGTGALTNDTTGARNSAFGFDALFSNTTGFDDTASGFNALFGNTKGRYNTASGGDALQNNTSGSYNTASGYRALRNNTTGFYNTASGFTALKNNTTGYNNTSNGFAALANNTTGFYNTASGFEALLNNTTGGSNTAVGEEALRTHLFGGDDTASGAFALVNDVDGFQNTAIGGEALSGNMDGFENTAIGFGALDSNVMGTRNVGVGVGAGNNIVDGTNNIEIGGHGITDESDTIRIGNEHTQSTTFIAGISGTEVLGNVVEVNSNGQLGISVSSARYKRDIRDIGDGSRNLLKLRPVSILYKNDPSATLQYGLVAEEVEQVYPELVTRGTDGKILSVRYLEFTALLLNELQKQAKETRELGQRLEAKDRQLAAQQHEIDALKQQNASINALSERLTALERQARTPTPQGLRLLARK